MPCSSSDVEAFLYKIKFYISVPGCFTFVSRDKNLRGDLALLGVSISEVKEIILQLTPSNYVKGPEQDRDFPGKDIWVFGYDRSGQEIYIKLSGSITKDHQNVVTCISFHITTQGLIYPFKKGGI